MTRHLAEHLATAGIATLRYDKRGVGASDGDYHSSGFHDNVADARAAIDAIRAHADLGGVVAVGHSEGALIATRLAATGAAIDGAVLLAGSARSGEDILRHQAIIASEAVPAFARALLKLFRTDVHKLQAKRIAQLDRLTANGCGLVTFHFSTFAPDALADKVLTWTGGYFDWEVGC